MSHRTKGSQPKVRNQRFATGGLRQPAYGTDSVYNEKKQMASLLPDLANHRILQRKTQGAFKASDLFNNLVGYRTGPCKMIHILLLFRGDSLLLLLSDHLL
jgi:hypothetical protein